MTLKHPLQIILSLKSLYFQLIVSKLQPNSVYGPDTYNYPSRQNYHHIFSLQTDNFTAVQNISHVPQTHLQNQQHSCLSYIPSRKTSHEIF